MLLFDNWVALGIRKGKWRGWGFSNYSAENECNCSFTWRHFTFSLKSLMFFYCDFFAEVASLVEKNTNCRLVCQLLKFLCMKKNYYSYYLGLPLLDEV